MSRHLLGTLGAGNRRSGPTEPCVLRGSRRTRAPPPAAITLVSVSRMSRMRAPVLAAAGGLAACAYVYAVDPSEPGHFPPCPLKVFTGLDCPFCGGLRATHDLLHGNLAAAVDYNALTTVFVLPVTMLLLIAWTVQRWRGKPFALTLPRPAMAVLVVAVLAFTVVRNVPGMPWGTAA